MKNEKDNKTILSKVVRPFIPIDEAAIYLGYKLSSLYQFTHKNLIKFYKVRGRKIFFKKEDLDNFILNESNLVNSTDDINRIASTILLDK